MSSRIFLVLEIFIDFYVRFEMYLNNARVRAGFWSRVHNSFVRMTGILGAFAIRHDGYLRHPNEYFLLNQLHRCHFFIVASLWFSCEPIVPYCASKLFIILSVCGYLKQLVFIDIDT